MDGERYALIQELFLVACDQDEAAREAYLRERCGHDAALRAEVEKLLRRDAQPDRLLRSIARRAADGSSGVAAAMPTAGSSVGAAAAVDPASLLLPPRIAHFRPTHVLGLGGMGVVYAAEQDHPRRTVALKVIRPGLLTPASLQRFEREAQVLARLQHPGIAQIYEAGAADFGFGSQPYLAMEFVDGVPLLEYAQRHRLTVRGRLVLLAALCDAVQHAHQRGVIHRDLKPANIVVAENERSEAGIEGPRGLGVKRQSTGLNRERRGVAAPSAPRPLNPSAPFPAQPKILDFGVARLAEDDAQAATLGTVAGQVIGTLSYMSPEQAAGRSHEVDARCDVYALGLIGYELLAGRPAYDLRGLGIPEALRTLSQADPPPLGALNRALAGDIATIIARALEREIDRRYPSASALAGDIRHFLNDEPISARPATAAYQMWKFARRHRGAVLGAALAVLALLAGLIDTSWQALRALSAEKAATQQRDEAAAARDRAVAAAARAMAISAFLEDMLATAHPLVAGGRDTALLRAMLDDAAARVERDLADQPEAAGSIRATIGRTYLFLGAYDEALPHLRAGLSAAERFGAPRAAVAGLMTQLGLALTETCGLAEAEALLEQALEARRAALGERSADVADSLLYLGWLHTRQGRMASARALLRQANEMRRDVWPPADSRHVQLLVTLGSLEVREADFAACMALLPEGLERIQKTFPEQTAAQARRLHQEFLRGLLEGQINRSISLHVLEITQLAGQIAGPDHPLTAQVLGLAAVFLRGMDDYVTAESMLRQALAIQQRRLCGDHPDTATTLTALGLVLGERGRRDEAVELLRRALAMRTHLFGDLHVETAEALRNLGCVLADHGLFDEAGPLLADALQIRQALLGPEHELTSQTLFSFCVYLGRVGELAQAEGLLRDELALRRAALVEPRRSALAGAAAALLGRGGGAAQPAPLMVRTALTARLVATRSLLIENLTRQERFDEALALCDEWIRGMGTAEDRPPTRAISAQLALAETLLASGDAAAAECAARAAAQAVEDSGWDAPLLQADARYWIGRALLAQQRFDEAEWLLLNAQQAFERVLGTRHIRTRPKMQSLMRLYERWGRPEQVEVWRRRLESAGQPPDADPAPRSLLFG